MAFVREMHGYGRFVVLRGWPNEGTIFFTYPYEGDIEPGDAVKLNANGRVVKANDASEPGFIGFCLNSTREPNVQGSGKVVVLSSPFVAQTKNYDTTVSYVPGMELTVKNGMLAPAAAGDKVVGKVLYIDPMYQALVFLFTGV